MLDLARRLAWFFIVAAVAAYAIFLAAGSTIRAQTVDAIHIAKIRDALEPGSHHLSGIVIVPTTCSELTVRTEQLDVDSFHLIFTTWQEPSIKCSEEETPRSFRAVVFAPAAGVHFSATLDGAPLTIAVYQVIDHSN